MKVLAVIPARSGSRGLPGKNVRPCAGKPLLAWSIEAAMDSDSVDRVVVSSDSEEILRVGERWGAEPLLRPAELATDTAPTDPVLVHALGEVDADLVVLLQPTVPVREPSIVDQAIERLVKTGADSLLTGYPLHFVWWREDFYADTRTGGYLISGPAWRSQCPRRPRRQDMEHRELMWAEDGSVFVCTSRLLLETGRRLGGRIELLETGRTVDIDTEEDFRIAEAMLAARAAERTVA